MCCTTMCSGIYFFNSHDGTYKNNTICLIASGILHCLFAVSKADFIKAKGGFVENTERVIYFVNI